VKAARPLVSHDLEEAVYLADRVPLLSRYPARWPISRPSPSSGPQSPSALSELDFVRTKAHCLEIFQREVRRS
jgi:NitT/TauT family transport system ATP-binding protein